MELTQLKYFVLAAQLENLSKAALRLGVTQPSLTKSILKLEAELGVELFDRFGKRIVLNEQGKRFLEGALNAVQELEETSEIVADMAGKEGFRVCIGVYGCSSLLDETIAGFSKLHPSAEFIISDIQGIEKININEYDALLYPDIDDYARFRGQKLSRESYLLAVPADSPYSGTQSIKSLADAKFVIKRYGKRRSERAFGILLTSGSRPKTVCIVDSTEMHRRMISLGLGLGFVAESESAVYANDAGIRLCPLVNEEFRRDVMVCFKRDKHLSAIAREFKAYFDELQR